MSRRRAVFNIVALILTLVVLFVRREAPAWRLVGGAANGDHAAVRTALDAGLHPDARAFGLGSMNALWFAAYKGDAPMARLLLESGADPTPAWKTARLQGEHEVLALLLAAGAYVTPAEAEAVCGPAAETGDIGKLRRLLDPVLRLQWRWRDSAGAVNCRLTEGRTMLMLAARAGQAHACELLAAHHADINARDGQGRTALMHTVLAAKRTPVETDRAMSVVDALLENGVANVNIRDAFGWTARDYAHELGHEQLAARLTKAAKPREPH